MSVHSVGPVSLTIAGKAFEVRRVEVRIEGDATTLYPAEVGETLVEDARRREKEAADRGKRAAAAMKP